jgi:SAM-dependent methyltransferase
MTPLEAFDTIADDYDARPPRHFEYFAGWASDIAAERAILHGQALDVAAGTGAGVGFLAARFERVVGVDASPRMVAAARRRLAAAGVSNVEVQRTDVYDLQFPEPFDAVTCCFATFLFARPAEAIARLAAATTADAPLIIVNFGERDPRWAWLRQLNVGNGGARRGRLKDPQDLARALATANMHVDETLETTFDCAFDDEDHWYEWARAQGYYRYFSSLRPAELAEFRSDLRRLTRPAIGEDGRLHNVLTARAVIARHGGHPAR